MVIRMGVETFAIISSECIHMAGKPLNALDAVFLFIPREGDLRMMRDHMERVLSRFGRQPS